MRISISSLHKELLDEIIKNSGQATKHTFLDSYLGNKNIRYAIGMPKLRIVGKDWFKRQTFTPKEFFQFVWQNLLRTRLSIQNHFRANGVPPTYKRMR